MGATQVVLAAVAVGLVAQAAFVRRRGRWRMRAAGLLAAGALLVVVVVVLSLGVVGGVGPWSTRSSPRAASGPPAVGVWSGPTPSGSARSGSTRPGAVQPVLGRGGPGSLDARLAAVRRARHGTGSMVTDVTVPGRRTGYRWAAAVYLPAQYFAAGDAHRTFPVVELLGGSRSRPHSIFQSIRLQRSFDAAIAAHRLPPVIGVAPTRNPVPTPDRQCLDEPHGPATATYLAEDVPAAIPRLLRARTDRAGWALLGTSSGGYCAANLALRHPALFATVVSLSGYFSGAIEDRRAGMADPVPTAAERLANTPLDRVRKVRQAMSFVLVSARDDRECLRELDRFAAVIRGVPGDRVTTVVTPSGGHSPSAWHGAMQQILGYLGGYLRA